MLLEKQEVKIREKAAVKGQEGSPYQELKLPAPDLGLDTFQNYEEKKMSDV